MLLSVYRKTIPGNSALRREIYENGNTKWALELIKVELRGFKESAARYVAGPGPGAPPRNRTTIVWLQGIS
ncbi:hypothetical protein EVAR_29432_1 [Eumeta japonica]|uniref:Uncharacterized protein n=1 Tax=Eumeta variegata TaxID=151549 RepID=A0A4C1VW48_EUMVA|nr:hypothetical protein EVAR_29432_1 [Eumeta japonica]